MKPVIVRAYHFGYGGISCKTIIGKYNVPISMLYEAILRHGVSRHASFETSDLDDECFVISDEGGFGNIIEGVIEGCKATDTQGLGHDKYGFEEIDGSYFNIDESLIWDDIKTYLDNFETLRTTMGDDELLTVLDI